MEVKLEKSKKLTISKNSLKSYLFQIGAASDALLTDRKANSLEILT